MSTETAPTQEEIAALTGSDLDAAIERAGIDASAGGSTRTGALSAEEKRIALQDHYGAESPTEINDTDDDKSLETPEASAPEKPTDAPDTDPDDEPTVEERRDAQLKAGETTGKVRSAALARGRMNAAEQRAGQRGAKPSEGRVDNMTRRDDSDVLQGHFCLIDFSNDDFGEDALKAVEAVVGEGNAGRGRADYGVYIEPGELDNDGYPLTVTVMLRDEHSALVSSVPYGALLPAAPGGRR